MTPVKSNFKSMFDDISCKVLDSDYGLLMPDYSDAEVDQILRIIYGFESNTNPHLDPFKVDFNEKDRSSQKEKNIRKPKVEQQEEKDNEDDADYLFSSFGEAVNFDVKPVVKSKRRGRKY